jgi:aryl carrier-like protein
MNTDTDRAHRAGDQFDALSPAKRRLLQRLTGCTAPGDGAEISELEQTLKAIWLRVLGGRDYGVDDNFFRMGGDSILGIRVRNLVLEETGVDLEVQQLYDHPTIRQLARFVESLRGVSPAARAERIDAAAGQWLGERDLPAGVVDVYPMSDMQKGMAFHAELGRSESSYVNHGAALIEGPWSVLAFAAALDGIARRHDVLRACFDFTSYARDREDAPRRCRRGEGDRCAEGGRRRAAAAGRLSRARSGEGGRSRCCRRRDPQWDQVEAAQWSEQRAAAQELGNAEALDLLCEAATGSYTYFTESLGLLRFVTNALLVQLLCDQLGIEYIAMWVEHAKFPLLQDHFVLTPLSRMLRREPFVPPLAVDAGLEWDLAVDAIHPGPKVHALMAARVFEAYCDLYRSHSAPAVV